jgi:hypothetical protein
MLTGFPAVIIEPEVQIWTPFGGLTCLCQYRLGGPAYFGTQQSQERTLSHLAGFNLSDLVVYEQAWGSNFIQSGFRPGRLTLQQGLSPGHERCLLDDMGQLVR